MRILANYGARSNGDSYSVTFETMGDVPAAQAPATVDELFRLARDRVLNKKAISRVRVVMGLNKHFSTWRMRRLPKGAGVPRAGHEVSP